MSDSVKTIVLKITKRRGGKGSRKIGRSKIKCARYRDRGQKEKNKLRKAKKHARLLAKKAMKKGRREKGL